MTRKFYILIFLFVIVFAVSCTKDKYIGNRFAGIYEITKYTSELWDSTGMISSTEYPCNYKFYLNANENEFGNAVGKMDTSGVEPSFLTPLQLNLFQGFDRFTFEWNIGTSDNYRLNLLKEDGLITRSVIVNVNRSKLGKVKEFTYFIKNANGTYYFDRFEIKEKN